MSGLFFRLVLECAAKKRPRCEGVFFLFGINVFCSENYPFTFAMCAMSSNTLLE